MSADEENKQVHLETSSVSAEEYKDEFSGKEDQPEEKQLHRSKERHSKHSIPSHIKDQISSLPDVEKYIRKLLHKLESYKKDYKKLKRKTTKTLEKVCII